MGFSVFGVGSWLEGLLGQFGIRGQLAILFAVFFVDAVLFPMLPEAFVLYFYSIFPTVDTRFSPRADVFLTALAILVVVLAAEVVANAFLYAVVRWKHHRIPPRMTRAMNKWREFLLVHDERVVLLNRLVPVVPFTGAFMAVSPWDPRRAMGYLVLGGALKYGALLAIVAFAGVATNFDASVTWKLTLALLAFVIGLSLASQGWLRRRLKAEAQSGAPAREPLAPEPPPP
jgi:hypothetical protein